MFDDSQGLIGFAPSNKYLAATITEGVVPTEELYWRGMNLPKKNETADDAPDHEKKRSFLPDFAHPLDFLSSMIGSIEDLVLRPFSGLTGETGSSTTTWLVVIVGGASLAALAAGVVAYLAWQYLKYSSNGGSIRKATAGYEMTLANQARKGKSPTVQTSNLSDP